MYKLAVAMLCFTFIGNVCAESNLDKVGGWKGEWRDKATNEYDELFINNLTNAGFSYSNQFRESKHMPVGYTQFLYQGKARFTGPDKRKAEDKANGIVFVLIQHEEKWRRTINMKVSKDKINKSFPVVRATFEASFNCEKAGTSIEHTICNTEELARADIKLGKLYSQLRKKLKGTEAKKLRTSQRGWIKLRNRNCLKGKQVDKTCLMQVYGDRLLALTKLSDSAYGSGNKLDMAYVTAAYQNDPAIWNDPVFKSAMSKVIDPLLIKVLAQTEPTLVNDGIYLQLKGHYNPPQLTIIREYEYQILIDHTGQIWVGLVFMQSVEGEGIFKSDVDIHSNNKNPSPAMLDDWLNERREYIKKNSRRVR